MIASEERPVVPRRSFIFTPGLKPEMFPKALASGADMVCVELEDGIAPKDKDAARKNALVLFETPQANDGVERIVRINCLREAFGVADVQAILATDTPPPALMLPKVRTPDEVVWLDELLTERGHILASPQNPKILVRDDSEIVGDGVAPRRPLSWQSSAEEIVDGFGEEGEAGVEAVVGHLAMHDAP